MNILCLDQFSELGGAQRCLLDLLPAMTGRGWKVHVAAPGDGPLRERAAGAGATVDRIRSGPYSSGRKTARDWLRFGAELPRLAGEIRRLAERHDAHLIYVNGPRLLPAVAVAARRGPHVLFHAHSLVSGLPLWLAGRAIDCARAAIVAACRFVALPLLPFSGDRGISIIYNGVRPMTLAARTPAHGEFRIGVIGRISPEKGQAEFLQAARTLYGAAPQCRFLICGGPLFSDRAALAYQASLETLADGLPVEFTGWTEHVENMLARLDLLVVPSTAVDATPRVILEAFAAGVPVVAYASGGIPELVEHGVTGFLVEKRSPRALALAILDALESPGKRHEAAERARAKTCREFSIERYQRQMLAVIERA